MSEKHRIEAADSEGNPVSEPIQVGGRLIHPDGKVEDAESGATIINADGDYVGPAVDTDAAQTGTPTYHDYTETGVTRQRPQGGDLPGFQFARPSATVFNWVLDDGYDDHYQHRDVWKNKGVKPTLAIITQEVGNTGKMTWDQIDELTDPTGDYGWPVASHGQTNVDLSTASQERKYDEIVGSKLDLWEKAFEYQNPNLAPQFFLKPQQTIGGDFGRGLAAFAGYRFILNGNESILNDSSDLLDVSRIGADSSSNSTSQLKTEVDNAGSAGVGAFFGSHNIVDGTQSDTTGSETSTQKIKDVIDYVKNQGYEWVGPMELVSRQGGMFYIGGPKASFHSTFAGNAAVSLGGTEKVEFTSNQTKVKNSATITYTDPDTPILKAAKSNGNLVQLLTINQSDFVKPGDGSLPWDWVGVSQARFGNVYSNAASGDLSAGEVAFDDNRGGSGNFALLKESGGSVYYWDAAGTI